MLRAGWAEVGVGRRVSDNRSMTLPLDLLSRSLRGDPDEDRLRAALGNLHHTTRLGMADQAAAIHMLAQVLSINPNADQQTSEERRQIAGYLASFGERVAEIGGVSAELLRLEHPASQRRGNPWRLGQEAMIQSLQVRPLRQ